MWKTFLIRNVHRFSVFGYICVGFCLGVGLNALCLISFAFALVCDFVVSLVASWDAKAKAE